MKRYGRKRLEDSAKISRQKFDMWRIKHIFDGEYGCEERQEGGTKLSITLINEGGEERYVTAADDWLTKRNLNEGDIWPEGFLFRNVRQEEAEEVSEIEHICFPPNEACSEKHMKERVQAAPELFIVAEDLSCGKIAGFLNGLATKETVFRDEFFTDAALYDPEGENIMLLGLDVRPEYRKKGLAREIIRQYIAREQKKGRKRLVLTCLDSKVSMYQKFGFRDLGIAQSTWGGESWHEMEYKLL